MKANSSVNFVAQKLYTLATSNQLKENSFRLSSARVKIC